MQFDYLRLTSMCMHACMRACVWVCVCLVCACVRARVSEWVCMHACGRACGRTCVNGEWVKSIQYRASNTCCCIIILPVRPAACFPVFSDALPFASPVPAPYSCGPWLHSALPLPAPEQDEVDLTINFTNCRPCVLSNSFPLLGPEK